MRTLVALGLCLAATAAVAQPRPSTPSLPCARAAALVQTQGALVLGTGGYTYDRFVSGGSFCLVGERPEPAWVPSADSPQCFVGYRCRQRERFN